MTPITLRAIVDFNRKPNSSIAAEIAERKQLCEPLKGLLGLLVA